MRKQVIFNTVSSIIFHLLFCVIVFVFFGAADGGIIYSFYPNMKAEIYFCLVIPLVYFSFGLILNNLNSKLLNAGSVLPVSLVLIVLGLASITSIKLIEEWMLLGWALKPIYAFILEKTQSFNIQLLLISFIPFLFTWLGIEYQKDKRTFYMALLVYLGFVLGLWMPNVYV